MLNLEQRSRSLDPQILEAPTTKAGSALDLKPKTLSRRNFLKAAGFAGVGAVLAACGVKTENVTRTAIATATATVVASTPTPEPTATSTSTPEPTSTPTEAPSTATATEVPPTSTASPTPAEELRSVSVVFKDDFESGEIKYGHGLATEWNNPHEFGGIMEIIDDPTNSGRGKILKCTIKGPPVLLPNYGSVLEVN